MEEGEAKVIQLSRPQTGRKHFSNGGAVGDGARQSIQSQSEKPGSDSAIGAAVVKQNQRKQLRRGKRSRIIVLRDDDEDDVR